jgi:hypothetical protein
MRPNATRLVGCVLLFAALFIFQTLAWGQALVEPLIVHPVDEAQLTVLRGNTHPLAQPQFDQGAAPQSLPMERMLLVLRRSPDQETALRNLLDDQQDKASPNYHKWLTPEQFGRQFGPTDQDIQIVTSWLQAHGFQIAQVAKGRTVIEFSGTAGQVQEAFHTAIHKYLVGGEEHWANANDPQIPSALTPVVAGVHTLHNFLKKPYIHVSKQPVAAKFSGGPTPHVTFSDGTHALGPFHYAKIYNIPQTGATGRESPLPSWDGQTSTPRMSLIFGARSAFHSTSHKSFSTVPIPATSVGARNSRRSWTRPGPRPWPRMPR